MGDCEPPPSFTLCVSAHETRARLLRGSALLLPPRGRGPNRPELATAGKKFYNASQLLRKICPRQSLRRAASPGRARWASVRLRTAPGAAGNWSLPGSSVMGWWKQPVGNPLPVPAVAGSGAVSRSARPGRDAAPEEAGMRSSRVQPSSLRRRWKALSGAAPRRAAAGEPGEGSVEHVSAAANPALHLDRLSKLLIACDII